MRLRLSQPPSNSNIITEVMSGYNSTYPAFEFEKNFDIKSHQKWFADNWTISFYFCGAYLAFLLIGTKIMKEQKPFDLRLPLGIWSFSLAIFSAMGCIRLLPHWINAMTTSNDLLDSFCRKDFVDDRPATLFVTFFIWSKVVELGDTVFIILRKQKLIFLHWFHHVLTLIYSFYSLPSMGGPILWFCAMNTLIHTFMYTYYGIRALKLFLVPKFVNILITTSQIIQMIIGFTICIRIFVDKLSKSPSCDFPTGATASGIVVYSSFLILFLNFFIKNYFSKIVSDKKQKRKLN